MPFVIFTEHGARGLRLGLLREVVSSKATLGNPTGIRTNGNPDSKPAHAQCVEFISTTVKPDQVGLKNLKKSNYFRVPRTFS